MKKLLYTTVIVALLCFGQTPRIIAAEDTESIKNILISEVQTGGATDSTEEFVELYNPNEISIDLTGWLLQYHAASFAPSQKWASSTTKATIKCTAAGSTEDCQVVIKPKMRLVLVNKIANIADALSMTGGFSAGGGEIRLVKPGDSPIVQDFVGYGTAQDFETAAAPAPNAGSSIKRVDSANGEPSDSDNNMNDFIIGCGSPTPGQDDSDPLPLATGCLSASPPPAAGATDDDETADTNENLNRSTSELPSDADNQEIAEQKTFLPVLITEVFPDPASPQLDSSDEFIELYNPNDTVITLNGYHLQTGSDYRYDYVLGDTPLPPRGYIAILSAVSRVSLANSGSGVRLIDPSGNIVAEAPNYSDAKEGQSWMLDDAGWHWTLTATPGAANIFTAPAPKILSSAPTASKKTSSKNASSGSTKTSTPKVSSTKTPTAKKAAASTDQKSTSPEEPKKSFDQQYWLLLPFALLAFGYMIYEYRQEIKKAYNKLQRKIFSKTNSTQNEFD